MKSHTDDTDETEKPLHTVGNDKRTMVERVIQALTQSNRFTQVVAIVSPNTPRTARLLSLIGIRLIETLGTGYSNDLSFVPRFSPEKVLLVPADLPLIDYVIVGKIMDSLQSHRASAISIILTKRFVEASGVRPSVILDFQGVQCCHAGITLYDSRQFQAGLSIPEEYVLMNQLEIAVNVNTKEELEIARSLLVERTKNLAKDHSS